MKIDSIKNGYVLDHIKAGNSMRIYNYLNLEQLECSVAILKNVKSSKMGRKDIMKIDSLIDLDFDVLGYIDPGITINIIENDGIVAKRALQLPERLTNVIRCKNPRCITSTEQELDHVFKLTDRRKPALPLHLLRSEGQEGRLMQSSRIQCILFRVYCIKMRFIAKLFDNVLTLCKFGV